MGDGMGRRILIKDVPAGDAGRRRMNDGKLSKDGPKGTKIGEKEAKEPEKGERSEKLRKAKREIKRRKEGTTGCTAGRGSKNSRAIHRPVCPELPC
ncbi:hypothetical protein FA13DRAFT_139591 [Coprinellus micaceus]|uniref:Uncharacterized protein n=1 Tax=Coprinellus micaceus TaxID=71717 RepID=A0A4Y7SHW5_COPMI|nr:hypothetical protein FA13DRAFT_139591 [Coprinellus micaceus]